jgi:hypothetical protein
MSVVVKELGKKWEQIYDDVDETVIWRYDTSKKTRPVVKTKKVTRKVTLNK